MTDIKTITPEDVPPEPKIFSRLDIDANSWFEAREDGLWFIEKKSVGKGENKTIVTDPTQLTAVPFEIVGRLVPIDGDNQRGLIVRIDKREITVPSIDVSREADVSVWLNDHGVRHDSRKKSLLSLYFSMADASSIRAYTRNGWQKDGAFVIGERIIRGEGRVLKTQANLTAFDSQGSFEEWRDIVLPLAAQKPGWLLGILVGLSSPLLKPLGLATGYGFNLHGPSSTGKTIALQAAAGVWGRPDAQGCLKSFNTTVNAIEGLAEGHSHIGLALDEMKKADPRVIRESIYMLANGQGKERMKSNAEMQRHRFWQVNTFVSSEKTVEDLFDASDETQAAGQVIRFIDIDGSELLPDLPWDQVREFETALLTYYGTVGPEFIRRIMDDNLTERHRAALQALYNGEDGRIQRAASGFALLSVAGEVMGIDTAVVKDSFDRWMAEDVVNALNDNFQIAKKIHNFIDPRLNNSIVRIADEPDEWDTSGEAGSTYQKRDGWFDDTYVYLLPDVVDKLREGYGRNKFYKWFKENDLIKGGEGSKNTVYVPMIKPRKRGVAFHLERLREFVG